MKPSLRIKRGLCLLLIIAMLASAACAPSNTEGENPGADSPEAYYTPQSGGTLRLPMPENARLDTPYIVNTEEMLNLFSLVYEGLLEIDNTGRLNPAVAESWVRSQEDSSTWILNLRKNVVFHTGARLTAQDVLYSYGTLRGYVTGDYSFRDSIQNTPQNTDIPDAGETDAPYNEPDEDTGDHGDSDDPDDVFETEPPQDEPMQTDEPEDNGEAFFAPDAAYRFTDENDPDDPTPPDPDIDPDPDPEQPTDPPSDTDEPSYTDPVIDDPTDEPIDPGVSGEPQTAAPGVTNRPQNNVVLTTAPPEPTYKPIEADASYYSYNIAKIRSMKVIDEYTVSVTMNTEGISALYALTFPIIPSCAGLSEGEKDLLPGTGPYRVASASEETVSLVVNPDWWKQKPYIANIVFEARVNNETALASYEAGQLNMVPTSQLSVGKYRKEGETNVLDVMTQEAELMIFNYQNGVFADATLRKAINYAIDASRISSNIFMNRAHISDVPVPPDSWFYNTESNIYEYNPTYADEILRNAGYLDRDGDGILESPTGVKLSFTLLTNSTADNTTRRNLAELIASQLLDSGIELIIETAPYYLDEAHNESQFIRRLESADYDIALIGVNLSRDGDLTELLSPEGGLNYGGLNFPEIFASAKAILEAEDETHMRDASYKFQTEFVDTLPFITLCFRQNSIVYSADIYGVENLREPDLLKNGITGFFINYSE